MNFIDGVRISFSNGDVSHIRPSGNAPEFRNYATSDTQERAHEIVEKRKVIVPEIVADLEKSSKPKSVGAKAAGESAEEVASFAREGKPIYLSPL